MGLEFLDVTTQLSVALIASSTSADDDDGRGEDDDGDRKRGRDGDRHGGRRRIDVYRFTNNTSSIVDTHLLLIARGLSFEIEMENASGRTEAGDPYRRLFLRDGVLLPGQSIVARLVFKRRPHAPLINYTLQLLSGQGNP